MPTQEEITTVFSKLNEVHQPTMLELYNHYTPFQMLIMTLLSARSKDATVIPIVVELFKDYPGPEDFINLEQSILEQRIYKIGFYKTKAKHVIKLSHILLNQFNGVVPKTLNELTSLPGVGRKTANCVLSYTFGIPAIAVDIHVHRIANRLGWINTTKESESEKALQELIPKEQWNLVNSMLVGHGQTICAPVKPKCGQCNITRYCNFYNNL